MGFKKAILAISISALSLLSITSAHSGTLRDYINANAKRRLVPIEKKIFFSTKDKVSIGASIFYPEEIDPLSEKKYPAVILFHTWKMNRYDWAHIIPQLRKDGFIVLAIDLRNHGSSDFKKGWGKRLRFHLTKMINDAEAAYHYALDDPLVDDNNISVMGSSIGAIIAIKLCAKINSISNENPIKSAVLVSPAKNYFGVTTSVSIQRCKKTAMLFVMDKHDPSPTDNTIYKSGMALYKLAKGAKDTLIFDGIGHGTLMMDKEKFIMKSTSWIKEHITN
ncbi:MAG: alpha/beta fold hydrolase [Candidatus Omnitrophica bacterium]|nr:alpha/beta fold hydrolase [Candidatus Omnitrophota bacterium]